MGALVFIVCIVAYFPALQAGFIWDDHPGHVTRPELRSLAGLARIWTDVGATQQYYPLLHSAFWVEHRLWGDSPFGYHLVNVLLHATSACLLAALLRRLSIPGAWFAALLFALHPVCVESVAWISEQKNTLSIVFYLSAGLVYLRYSERQTTRDYIIATTLFLLALLTKTITATLPAALLVILWWRNGRLDGKRDVLPLTPWFALGVGAGLLTASVEQTQIGAQGTDFTLDPIERVLLAGRAIWFYTAKLFWPAELIFIYPRWQIDASEAAQWVFPLTALGLIGILFWRRKQNRGALAGALLFGGTLFPALGFVNVFPFVYSFAADHFQYVASLAIFALVAAAGTSALSRFPAWTSRCTAALVLAMLGILTWEHARTFRDVFTLYETTLAKNPAAWMAHNNLAIALVDTGRAADALPHYERALALRPNYAEAENNLGYALNKLGRPADALPHLSRAIQLNPKYADAHNNLGTVFMALGRPADGIAGFTEALRLVPAHSIARFNLGLALASTGKPADAISHFQEALRLDPRYADAELNLGIALTVTGKPLDAFPHFSRAIELNPNSEYAHVSFGRALTLAGRLDDAVARFRDALNLNPNHAEAHYLLALALRQLGRNADAEQHLQLARKYGWR
jgi:tetratricopeptide (TPR) repeat protein